MPILPSSVPAAVTTGTASEPIWPTSRRRPAASSALWDTSPEHRLPHPPRRGRASYVGQHAIGVPDPGSFGVALLFTALAGVYEPATATRLPDPERLTAR
ncbi:DAK2 domain-containing protein [Streptomyces parvulus]|uniref:DAK2 domain-containing protein n=1 Tax=Streptomyces parvulus TaxID=146923 RepID=UPI003F4D6AAD